MSKIRILLLTNRDSDNVGDQVIEASVISLLKGAMHNLGIATDGFSINSRAAGIISKKYMQTRDPALLEDARSAISAADVIVFGGAPLFNYAYQNFYLRTIKTLELAEEYGVPVLFSSIGIEPFDGSNPKCLALKEALALPCVRQITTRDDFASLEQYVEGSDIPIAHVSDPAVFADVVFRPKPAQSKIPGTQGVRNRGRLERKLRAVARRVLRRGQRAKVASVNQSRSIPTPDSVAASATQPRKTIGLVVTRAGIFKDNQIEFSESDQREFWRDVMASLSDQGYDFRLFTTGHFSDEVFLDSFVRAGGAPLNRCAITVNSPEELIQELKACDGVIAYRLHASITAFALDVPSIGLSWNFKVPYFYDSVGYPARAIEPERWSAAVVVGELQRAMDQGVAKDERFLHSVYGTLFGGLKQIIAPDIDAQPYSYAELRSKLPRYAGTTQTQYREKVRRKFRRTYENYQKQAELVSRGHQVKR